MTSKVSTCLWFDGTGRKRRDPTRPARHAPWGRDYEDEQIGIAAIEAAYNG